MADIVVAQGLQRDAVNSDRATGTGVTFASERYVRTMSVDDSSIAFATGHTALNSGGAVSNAFDAAFDATPTRSNQTVTEVMTVPTGSGNFTIRRIAGHDDTAANVTTSSTTLHWGIDGQSLTKTSDFSLAITVTRTYTDNS